MPSAANDLISPEFLARLKLLAAEYPSVSVVNTSYRTSSIADQLILLPREPSPSTSVLTILKARSGMGLGETEYRFLKKQPALSVPSLATAQPGRPDDQSQRIRQQMQEEPPITRVQSAPFLRRATIPQ